MILALLLTNSQFLNFREWGYMRVSIILKPSIPSCPGFPHVDLTIRTLYWPPFLAEEGLIDDSWCISESLTPDYPTQIHLRPDHLTHNRLLYTLWRRVCSMIFDVFQSHWLHSLHRSHYNDQTTLCHPHNRSHLRYLDLTIMTPYGPPFLAE